MVKKSALQVYFFRRTKWLIYVIVIEPEGSNQKVHQTPTIILIGVYQAGQ